MKVVWPYVVSAAAWLLATAGILGVLASLDSKQHSLVVFSLAIVGIALMLLARNHRLAKARRLARRLAAQGQRAQEQEEIAAGSVSAMQALTVQPTWFRMSMVSAAIPGLGGLTALCWYVGPPPMLFMTLMVASVLAACAMSGLLLADARAARRAGYALRLDAQGVHSCAPYFLPWSQVWDIQLGELGTRGSGAYYLEFHLLPDTLLSTPPPSAWRSKLYRPWVYATMGGNILGVSSHFLDGPPQMLLLMARKLAAKSWEQQHNFTSDYDPWHHQRAALVARDWQPG